MNLLKRLVDLPVLQIARYFPYTVISSLAAAIYATLIILEVFDNDVDHTKYVLALIPGIVLGLTEGLWRLKTKLPLIIPVGYLIVAQAAFFILVQGDFDQDWKVFRWFVFAGIAHLFFAAGIWLYRNTNTSFWEENIRLLLRLVSATILTFLLWGSINLILFLLDYLFIPGDFVDDQVIGTTATWAFLFYHPMYFATGLIGERSDDAQVVTEHKVYFSAIAYILTPLMWIYIAIMFAYFIKIGIQWEWPKGGVSYWIAALSVFGTLLYLLGYPYFKVGKTKLNAWYDRFFFILTVPVILLLFLAIYTRISAYGWTENRYYVVFAGCWLLAIALYFIFSKTKKIAVIPLSLGAVLLIASVGPWSSFATARRSQSSELLHLLERYEVLKNGELIPNLSLPLVVRNRIVNVADFLDDRSAMHTFLKTHTPQLLESNTLGDEANFERIFTKAINIKSTVDQSTPDWVGIKSTDAIQSQQLTQFESVRYINKFDDQFNSYPYDGIESVLEQALIELVTNTDQIDSNGQWYSADCLNGQTDAIEFTFCCTDCQVYIGETEKRVDQISGLLFFSKLPR